MIRRAISTAAVAALVALGPASVLGEPDGAGGDSKVVVGSKKFTEAVILGEMLTQLAAAAGADSEHRAQLGGTRVLWNALVRGDLDAYAEYTGTLEEEIFADREVEGVEPLRAAVAEYGLRMSEPFGFNNTYALGMRRDVAERTGVVRISQLRLHPDLAFGFSAEFLDRGDGWPSLRDDYGLPQTRVRGLDHDLAYRGLAAGDVDVVDCYSTDAEIAYYDLHILEDDLRHFPDYHPVVLYRAELPDAVAAAFRRLEGRISETAMVAMNAAVKIGRDSETRVAARFLGDTFGLQVEHQAESRGARFWHRTVEHLTLVVISLGLAVLVALPLGVLAFKLPRAGQLILGGVGVLQTVPALAMLVFMIPLLGIGAPPALAALFLYSLLPIVRNTHAGLADIAPELRESAAALGLPAWTRLRRIELPLASRSILAGVKTSAVINIGTATLGALIGAGGYGQPILTGIRLDDLGLILEGAVPAALLALAAQGLFELAERLVVPAGLRLESAE
ncbi:MAG: glycine betaine ABC transporter substrate-binding protein [Thermoanaerobaculia bacterium]